MKLLIHAAEEDAQCLIDGHPFVIPPNETWEVPTIVGTDHNNNGSYEYTIPDNQVADLIRKHCWAFGMVEVPVVRTKGKFGTHYDYDVEASIAEAKAALIKAEETVLMNYVVTAQERLSQNLPAMPPNGRALYVITKRRIDLKRDFNIVPVGYGSVAASAAASEDVNALKQQLAEMQQKFNQLLTAMQPKAEAVTVPPEPEPAPKKKLPTFGEHTAK